MVCLKKFSDEQVTYSVEMHFILDEKFKILWKEAVDAYFKYYSKIWLKESRKET